MADDHPATRARLAALLHSPDESLIDVVDNLLTKGVVLDGELVLGLANVDLIYLRVSALLVAADRLARENERSPSGD